MFRIGKVRMWLIPAVAVVTLVAVGVSVAPAQQPISVTGWNADVIVDKDPTARHAQSFDGNAIAFFEIGAIDDSGTEHDDGLPAGQTFTSATGSGVVFAIQPAAGNNVLRIARTESATLTLATPAPYSMLAILAGGGSGGGMDDVVITYDDGSQDSFPAAYNTNDWCDNAQVGAITGLGRANPIGPYGLNFAGYTTECSFGLYESFLLPNPAKNVASITFHNQHAVYENVFAISGQ